MLTPQGGRALNEKPAPYLEEHRIEEALAEELDRVSPRRDLWPSIQAEVLRRQQKHRKWWQLPPFGPLVMLGGYTRAIRLTGVSLGSVAVALLLAWVVWLQPWQAPDSQVRQVSAYWASNAYDGFYQREGANPFVDTQHNRFCKFAVNVDPAAYSAAQRLVMEDGRLPDPGSVRSEEFVNYFPQEYPPPAEGSFAIYIEGGPSPFGGENHWLLRVGLRGQDLAAEGGQVVARDVRARAEFNPLVVSHYRQLGYEYRRVPNSDSTTGAMVAAQVSAGLSVMALYEVQLHPDMEGQVATVRVSYQDPGTGQPRVINRQFSRRELSKAPEAATPHFRRDAVVAEYAEVLRESYWARDSSLAEVSGGGGAGERLVAGRPRPCPSSRSWWPGRSGSPLRTLPDVLVAPSIRWLMSLG